MVLLGDVNYVDNKKWWIDVKLLFDGFAGCKNGGKYKAKPFPHCKCPIGVYGLRCDRGIANLLKF